ncbi:YcxB family protein [Thalassotalea psychrophila]|uniref:YcxB family protein n=1 Tax=Thalassotalea psychrophila TaxID=3065647 RepID=A0ABY9TQB7_9GAMM|nr:YcxB family protein [Colwelliaceae bacterium SQ149]
MNIEVNLTEEDFVQFNKYALKKVLSSKTTTILCLLQNIASGAVFGLVVMTIFKMLEGKSHSMWNTALFSVATLFFLYLIIIKVQQAIYMKKMLPNKDGLVLGSKKIELLENGIKEESQLGYNFYNWKAVVSIEEDKNTVYVFLDKAIALIFPNSSFSSEEEKLDFLTTIQNFSVK